MDQLTAVDGMFLDFEDETIQMNIGGLSFLEGPAPSFAELRQLVEANLGVSARYRQKMHELPSMLGRAFWVDDHDFDLDNHLIEVDLGKDIPDFEVGNFFSSVMAEHLDRDKPLWKIHICPNVEGDRWAILWTVHHAMVDGIAATALMGLLLSPDPNAGIPEVEEWTPDPVPATRTTAAKAATGAIGPARMVRAIGNILKDPKGHYEQAKTAFAALPTIGRAAVTGRPDLATSPINGPVGPGRRWRMAELDLAEVKKVAKRHGGTVNDIVLAAVTDGFREVLAASASGAGEDDGDHAIRTLVPVSVRGEDEAGIPTNLVSAVFVDLPVAEEDPLKRFQLVQEQMNAIKAGEGEQAGKALGEIGDLLPPPVFRSGQRRIVGAADVGRFFNTITTNVPGPQFTLYCLGRKMVAIHPYVVLCKDVRVATAVLSYDGHIYFGFTGDTPAIFMLERMVDGVNGTLARL
jgi:WS/DGAT/MGAT family acyltransferase